MLRGWPRRAEKRKTHSDWKSEGRKETKIVCLIYLKSFSAIWTLNLRTTTDQSPARWEIYVLPEDIFVYRRRRSKVCARNLPVKYPARLDPRAARVFSRFTKTPVVRKVIRKWEPLSSSFAGLSLSGNQGKMRLKVFHKVFERRDADYILALDLRLDNPINSLHITWTQDTIYIKPATCTYILFLKNRGKYEPGTQMRKFGLLKIL